MTRQTGIEHTIHLIYRNSPKSTCNFVYSIVNPKAMINDPTNWKKTYKEFVPQNYLKKLDEPFVFVNNRDLVPTESVHVQIVFSIAT